MIFGTGVSIQGLTLSHLNHASTLCCHQFSEHVLCFCLGLASYLCILRFLGTTGVHHPQLIG
jgi:hypothetical protein